MKQVVLTRRSLLALAIATGSASAQQRLQPGASLQAAIDEAADTTGVVQLGRGVFDADALRIAKPVNVTGIPGHTILRAKQDSIFHINAKNVTLSGLTLSSQSKAGSLVAASECENLRIEACDFKGALHGLDLQKCSGNITGNTFSLQEGTGIFSVDGRGMQISGNTISDIGNNGIQVWTSAEGEDGTIVADNRISRIDARDGGNGPNGNGIVVFRAAYVNVANNRISDTAFSAIRCNSGDNIQISGNSISRSREVAIYVEFGFQGAVVANNLLTDVAFGISVTNFDVEGRLASVTGNVIRRVTGGTSAGVTVGGAIHCEADTAVANNVIEDAKDFGISMGWGDKCRNLSATGNLIRDAGVGIVVSVTKGAGKILVANNLIAGGKLAIQGADYETNKPGDLLAKGAVVPKHITLTNNVRET